MAEPNNTELVERWRSLFRRYNSTGLGIDEKASILKDMLAEIQYHSKLGRISGQCYDVLNKKYTKEYARITQSGYRKDNGTLNVVLSDDTGESFPKEEVNIQDETEPVGGAVMMGAYSNESHIGDSMKAVPVTSHSSKDWKGEKLRSVTNGVEEVTIPKSTKIQAIPQTNADRSLLNLWSCARRDEDNPLISRPQKRKYISDSPISKKSSKSEHDEKPSYPCDFLTAGEQLRLYQTKKHGGQHPPERVLERDIWADQDSVTQYGNGQKSLGTRRGLSSKFVPPIPANKDNQKSIANNSCKDGEKYSDPIYQDDRLKNCEPRMIELILSEIMDDGTPMSWDDIAGLEFAKKTIQEIVVWPMLRPDIFTGLRGPPKGLLLFGPPGTGKTLIGKCIASQSRSTFFTISASSLTSKWVGEGEKMVRTLFTVARCHPPAVIFIDEIDSLLTQRSDQEHESSRRIKTEFLIQLDGACTARDERLLVVGATNRPQEIDEAARRRFVKRLYIPLPETKARRQIVENLLKDQKAELTDAQLDEISEKTDGYSGSDVANLCREAALGPIRSIPFGEIDKIAAEDVRPIRFCDFFDALEQVKTSVSDQALDMYVEWNSKFGSGKR